MNRPCFTMDYWRDGAWYVGRLREVPSVISQGKTLRELRTNIADAYRMIADDSRTDLSVGDYRTTVVGISL